MASQVQMLKAQLESVTDDALKAIAMRNTRIKELEAIAREIIKAHRDVETGLEVPKYIYKMAVAAIEPNAKNRKP